MTYYFLKHKITQPVSHRRFPNFIELLKRFDKFIVFVWHLYTQTTLSDLGLIFFDTFSFRTRLDFYCVMFWERKCGVCLMPVTETSWLSRFTCRNWSINLHKNTIACYNKLTFHRYLACPVWKRREKPSFEAEKSVTRCWSIQRTQWVCTALYWITLQLMI